jgi:hypothetical protein
MDDDVWIVLAVVIAGFAVLYPGLFFVAFEVRGIGGRVLDALDKIGDRLDAREQPFGIVWLGAGSETLGGLWILGMIGAYVKSIDRAYIVQKRLNEERLYNPGAWQVIVGALIRSPFSLGLLGFLIPASVLWTVRRLMRAGAFS